MVYVFNFSPLLANLAAMACSCVFCTCRAARPPVTKELQCVSGALPLPSVLGDGWVGGIARYTLVSRLTIYAGASWHHDVCAIARSGWYIGGVFLCAITDASPPLSHHAWHWKLSASGRDAPNTFYLLCLCTIGHATLSVQLVVWHWFTSCNRPWHFWTFSCCAPFFAGFFTTLVS